MCRRGEESHPAWAHVVLSTLAAFSRRKQQQQQRQADPIHRPTVTFASKHGRPGGQRRPLNGRRRRVGQMMSERNEIETIKNGRLLFCFFFIHFNHT
jgi:hypothetical protein